ncbi:hypothetical protein GCM10025868_30420 [Angustibacter aerolatus]|uniref:AB hydrolase-1 domain-containing protein n=1 Tax=Angustibacter aerolatus TaxID=1162965 RepID=A0ABQ6JHT3_9ACTN|nr:alpha/beta fold hydrolase [Angustibacter aerolatus]GMA87792.1 hypothetical protein GCM10025868_30420 [Angustibacter aerolatus]
MQVRGRLDGPVLLLVHGYPDTHTVWDRVVPLLEPHLRVVTYDVRGAGASGAPRRRTGYRLGRLAADLHAVAAAVSPDRPVHLVGHDWGSIQAWESVTTPGAPVASFTSVGGPCLDHLALWSRGPFTRAHLRRLRRSWYIGFFQPAGAARAALARRAGPRLAAGAQRAGGHRRAARADAARRRRARRRACTARTCRRCCGRRASGPPTCRCRWCNRAATGTSTSTRCRSSGGRPACAAATSTPGTGRRRRTPSRWPGWCASLVADVEAGRFRPDAG